MPPVPADLQNRLRSAGQEHVLRWWDRLSDDERQELTGQIQALDLDQLARLFVGATTFNAAVDGGDSAGAGGSGRFAGQSALSGASAKRRCAAAKSRCWWSPAGRARDWVSIIPRGFSQSAPSATRVYSRFTPRKCWP